MKRVIVAAVVLLAAAGAALGYGYWYFLKRTEVQAFSSAEERFKYGTIGAEGTSLPYYVWEVLPEVCPDDIGEKGYAAFGFTYEPGRAVPLGISVRTVGIPRASFNCATCHTGAIRKSPEAKPEVLIGMPSYQLDFKRYVRFLFTCIGGDRFTPERVMAEIVKRHALSAAEYRLYRDLVVPGTRDAMMAVQGQYYWLDKQAESGPGRFDSFTGLKVKLGLDISKDDDAGFGDLPALWNQKARTGFFAHWDASNSSVQERNVSAALSAGATPDSLDFEALTWMGEFIHDLAPPKFPFPADLEQARAGRGVFEAHCARCHEGASAGQVTPIDRIGTDPHRYQAFTQALADGLNTIGTGYPWKFRNWRKSEGYANVLLDAVWARAPYLHNASVPTLHDLLQPAEARPRVFYTGYDVYDPVKVGFVHEGREAEAAGFRFDVSVKGNGNGGHLYGTELPDGEKASLLEYLKTL
jgi:mono/diheme cytochrome c family protein